MAEGLAVGWAGSFGGSGGAERVVTDAFSRLTAEGLSGLSGMTAAREKTRASVGKIPFGESALGRSSAAGIGAVMASAARDDGDRRLYEIRLEVDGEEAASALFDPLRAVAKRKGGEGILA